MSYEISVNTFPFLWDMPVEACLGHLADRGYRNVEVMLTEPHCWPLSLSPDIRARVARRVQAGELVITSVNLGGFDNNMASQSAEVRELAVRIVSSVLELAADWGANGIIVSPGAGRPLLPAPPGRLHDALRSCLDRLLPVAERVGVDLLLENIPYSFLPRADGLGSLVESVGSARLGICYDVPNAVFAREDVAAGFRRLARHIRLVHFSDTVLETWRHDRIGAGIVDFRAALDLMKEIDYSGPLVLEIIDPDGDVAIDESVSRVLSLYG